MIDPATALRVAELKKHRPLTEAESRIYDLACQIAWQHHRAEQRRRIACTRHRAMRAIRVAGAILARLSLAPLALLTFGTARP